MRMAAGRASGDVYKRQVSAIVSGALAGKGLSDLGLFLIALLVGGLAAGIMGVLVGIQMCIRDRLGTVQPVREIAALVHRCPNCRLHVDATQAVGKTALWLDCVDTMSFTAHKFYGPNGIDVLYKRKGLVIEPQMNGGASTTIYRSGTDVYKRQALFRCFSPPYVVTALFIEEFICQFLMLSKISHCFLLYRTMVLYRTFVLFCGGFFPSFPNIIYFVNNHCIGCKH